MTLSPTFAARSARKSLRDNAGHTMDTVSDTVPGQGVPQAPSPQRGGAGTRPTAGHTAADSRRDRLAALGAIAAQARVGRHTFLWQHGPAPVRSAHPEVKREVA